MVKKKDKSFDGAKGKSGGGSGMGSKSGGCKK